MQTTKEKIVPNRNAWNAIVTV